MTTTGFTYLQTGDTVTCEGLYRRRTFWQWIRRQPRQLQVFTLGPPQSVEGVPIRMDVLYGRADIQPRAFRVESK